MKRARGFTLIELLVTITIMVILMTLAVANFRSTQADARDADRLNDAQNIVRTLDTLYTSGFSFTDSDSNVLSFKGSYPTTTQMNDISERDQIFDDLPKNSRVAAGHEEDDATDTVEVATNAVQTVGGVTNSPGIDHEYVYQPIDSAGALCTTSGDCRSFNLFYRTEVDGVIHMIKGQYR